MGFLPFSSNLAEFAKGLTNSVASASFIFGLAGYLVEFVLSGLQNFVIAVS